MKSGLWSSLVLGLTCLYLHGAINASPSVVHATSTTVEPQGDTAQEIERLLAELRDLRDERATLVASFDVRIDALRDARDALQEGLEETRGELGTLRQRREDLRTESAWLERTLANVAAFRERVADATRSGLERWLNGRAKARTIVDAGERVGRARELLEDLASERGDPTLTLWTWLAEELRLAGTLELRNEPVDLSNAGTSSAAATRRIHAYVLRLGLAYEAFGSEDGTEAGVVENGGWRTDLGELRTASITAILDTLRGRSAPGLLPLPIPSSATDAGAAGGSR